MKKPIRYLFFVVPLLLLSAFVYYRYFYEPEYTTEMQIKIFDKKMKDLTRQRAESVEVNFGNSIVLFWNKSENEFMKNSHYDETLRNSKNLIILAESIADTENLGAKLCTKTNAPLRKGDVAFLFLYKNGKINPSQCLKVQFDEIDSCGIPSGMMNYVENNRLSVLKKVKNSLEN